MSARRPPRISGFCYVGPHAYFLTICTFDRIPWFGGDDRAQEATSQLSRTASAYGFALVAYCVMPDHVHALVEGLRPDSHLLKFVAMFKQRTAFDHARMQAGRLWQEGFFDRVLRDEDDVLGIAAYIVANPLRAGLCGRAADYPHVGSDRYTIEQLCEAVQMAPMSRP